ncbi:response regulator transcription factor [Chitinophaga sp. HK235]|uniref:response regulator transcription factor n=1 Tax=Chitinophaga sp. HK235 TaxID=2952571 RepID=UPI001BA54B28|nr:response regulator transcription factor [Chitinophaga sp. HK235]
MIHVIIYDDTDQFRESLSVLINDSGTMKVMAAFNNCETIEKDIAQLQPDVILLDIDMPVITGIEAVKRIRAFNTTVKILMLTAFDDDKTVFDALKYGANGYLLKKTVAPRLLTYIQDVYEGGAPMTASIVKQVLRMFTQFHHLPAHEYNLSEKEKAVLQLLVDGKSYKMVAAHMEISIDTVRTHIRNIYEELQVNSKSEAVAKALRDRIV